MYPITNLGLLEHLDKQICISDETGRIYELLGKITTHITPNIHRYIEELAVELCRANTTIYIIRFGYDKETEYIIAKRHLPLCGLNADDLDRVFSDYPVTWAKIVMANHYVVIIDDGEGYMIIGFPNKTTYEIFTKLLHILGIENLAEKQHQTQSI